MNGRVPDQVNGQTPAFHREDCPFREANLIFSAVMFVGTEAGGRSPYQQLAISLIGPAEITRAPIHPIPPAPAMPCRKYRYSRYSPQSLTQQNIQSIPKREMTIRRLCRVSCAQGAGSSPRQGSISTCCRFLIFRRRREPSRKWSEDSGGCVASRRTGLFPAVADGEAHALEAFLPGFLVLGLDGISCAGSCARIDPIPSSWLFTDG